MNNFDIYRLIHAGGPTITIEPKSITENGVYTAAEGTAFSPVTVDVPQPSGSVSITENGTVDVADYESAVVNVPNPSTGSIAITENGTVDVTDYANAVVNVPNPSTGSLPITENGTYNVTDYASAEVNVSSGIPEHGVFFLDYDGTILDAWAFADVVSKTALPDNPTNHPRLVGQGWNWTLANIKSYVQNHPNADVWVGQMYKTVSGLTEIDITLTKVTGLEVNCKMSGTKNWGDGTSDSAKSHTYTNYGNYMITCDGTSVPTGSSISSGMFGASSSNVHRFYCTAIRLGEKVTSIGQYAFSYCRSLTSVTIPDGVTSIGNSAFYYCYALTSITIPDGVTDIVGAFYYCYSLTSITIPDGVTDIGNNTFTDCCSITSITIPDGVTSIGGNTFTGCCSITSITIPDGVTSIGSTFSRCYSLTSVTIPDGVTSIGGNAFSSCYALTSITIPDGVTDIGGNAFSSCYSLIEYDFSSATAVPTLSNTSAFNAMNGLCKILVPSALYDTWIAATNWATYADHIYAV